jgi:hypothetical protein
MTSSVLPVSATAVECVACSAVVCRVGKSFFVNNENETCLLDFVLWYNLLATMSLTLSLSTLKFPARHLRPLFNAALPGVSRKDSGLVAFLALAALMHGGAWSQSE